MQKMCNFIWTHYFICKIWLSREKFPLCTRINTFKTNQFWCVLSQTFTWSSKSKTADDWNISLNWCGLCACPTATLPLIHAKAYKQIGEFTINGFCYTNRIAVVVPRFTNALNHIRLTYDMNKNRKVWHFKDSLYNEPKKTIW